MTPDRLLAGHQPLQIQWRWHKRNRRFRCLLVYHLRCELKRTLSRYALTQTRDWSSASTGSTVFDFNGDGAAEIVFADEDALYVWGVDTASWLDPWERLYDNLTDSNHRSWTIHEYPVVADVDGDGKSEIVVMNSGRPNYEKVLWHLCPRRF